MPGENPAYRFQLMSRESRLAPDESPEPALSFMARVAGTYDIVTKTLSADQIGVKSGPGGEALGKASVQFVDDQAPGIFLAFNVHDMSVAHVKQLWPWFSAHTARRWVLQNLFGGRVVDGSLQFDVKPGRLGNGVPLNSQEVFGRFEIDGSRFDTAGRIPPVRDAKGVVEFHANDVDVSLSSGTVFLPSGRTVAASNGTLKVAKANIMPVIGALDIDVAGSADAVAELASYDPINAMRHVGILPEELTGDVTGKVRADIPLTKGIDTDKLDWTVELNYEGLSVAKPFDGQKLSDATGTITVTPGKAVIGASGKLNGVPAELDLVEPLRDKEIAKERNVQFVLDDKARNALVPGLSDMLSGTIKVDVEQLDGGKRNIEADLTAARLDIPWVGWSKGPGIPARVIVHDGEGRRALDAVRFPPRRQILRHQGQCLARQWRPGVGAFRRGQAQPRRRCRRQRQARRQGLFGPGQGQFARCTRADQAVHVRCRHRHQIGRVKLGVGHRASRHADRLQRRKAVQCHARLFGRRLEGEWPQGFRHRQFGRRGQRQQCRAGRRAAPRRALGRCRRHPAVPRHL